MSSSYTVISGDTFETVARKAYGTEQKAGLIVQANPGVTVLTPGIELVIPADAAAPRNLPQQVSTDNPDEVAIYINGKRFFFFTSYRITRSMDAFSMIELVMPYEPDVEELQVLKPYGYELIEVTVADERVFAGTVINIRPSFTTTGGRMTVKAYAKPGVLNDCTAPASMAPLEFDGQTIKEITETLCKPFGIAVKLLADPGAVFGVVGMNAADKIFPFLVKLCGQRNLIITDETNGDLILWQSIAAGSPVATFGEGSTPLLSVTPEFSGQDYYSHITGVEPALPGFGGEAVTVRNEQLKGVVRPLTYQTDDTGGGSVKDAINAKMGRMFANMASYTITLNTWRDSKGRLWEPNQTVKLTAPRSMIFNPYEFIIRTVTFEKSATKFLAKLNLIIPGGFSGEQPQRLPWDR